MTYHGAEQRRPPPQSGNVEETQVKDLVFEAKGTETKIEKTPSESQDETASQEHSSGTRDDDDFPDGGLRAWLVVLGVSFN